MGTVSINWNHSQTAQVNITDISGVASTSFSVNGSPVRFPYTLTQTTTFTTSTVGDFLVSVKAFGLEIASQTDGVLTVRLGATSGHVFTPGFDSSDVLLSSLDQSIDPANAAVKVPVASRCTPYNQGLSNGTDTSGTFTIKHTLVHSTGDVQLRYANFYNATGVDTVGPNNISVKASVQIVDQLGASQVIPVFFSGKRTVTIEPGAVVDSDPVALDQVVGATFYSKTFVSVTSGQRWPLGIASSPSLVEGNNRGVGGADLTDSTTLPSNVNEFSYSPVAILGNAPTLKTPVVAGVGDSVLAGSGDGNTNGFFYRALSGVAAEQRIAYPSEQAYSFRQVKFAARRLPLIRNCTHAVCEYGINDVKSGIAAASVEVYLKDIWVSLARRGIRVWQTTLTPVTTSTDSWATTVNQTVTANESNRVAINTWIRAGAPLDPSTLAPVAVGTSGALVAGATGHPLKGYLEMADVVETSRNSGIWQAAWTSDGTHPLTVAHTAMAAIMPASMFTF